MNYDSFIKMLNQEIVAAQRICEETGSRESAVKALLFRGRSLTEAEKEAEYLHFTLLVNEAEELILTLALFGRETLEPVLREIPKESIEEALNTQVHRFLRREKELDVEAYRLPDSTIAAIGALRSVQLSRDEQLQLLRSLTLSNGMHDAAKGALTLSGNAELVRRMDRLHHAPGRSLDEEDRRQFLAALLLNMRRRGMLPDELEILHEGKPILSDTTLAAMFMCADEHMQEFTRTGEKRANWGEFWANFILCTPMLISAAAGIAALIINVVHGINNPISFASIGAALEGILLGPVADILIVLYIAASLWVILEPAADAIRALFPEETELDREARSFEHEMRGMARTLFNRRASQMNASALYIRNREEEDEETEHERLRHRETLRIRETE